LRNFFTWTWFWRGLEKSVFCRFHGSFSQEFLRDRNSCICTGFLQIPPNSSGFLFPPKAVWLRPVNKEGSLLSKIWTKIHLFNLSPEQDLTMAPAAHVLCWRLPA
jgi:hypothetical protein